MKPKLKEVIRVADISLDTVSEEFRNAINLYGNETYNDLELGEHLYSLEIEDVFSDPEVQDEWLDYFTDIVDLCNRYDCAYFRITGY